MSLDHARLSSAVAKHRRVARVVIADTQGSVPRETGAAMLVWGQSGQDGTIGGGALEWDAAARARAVLAGQETEGVSRVPLGPALGQCCGGSVVLLTEIWDKGRLVSVAMEREAYARPVSGEAGSPPLPVSRYLSQMRRGTEPAETRLIDGWIIEPIARPRHALWLYGAGHVGRAIATIMVPLPDWSITWVDTAADRFPEEPPSDVDVFCAVEPALAVAHAPRNAHHLILTYSHALDLALCDAVLKHGFASAGLIGSSTKWARFRKRLAEAGHGPSTISRIDCPIGDPSLGKHPQAIAIGVASRLARVSETFVAREKRA